MKNKSKWSKKINVFINNVQF